MTDLHVLQGLSSECSWPIALQQIDIALHCRAMSSTAIAEIISPFVTQTSWRRPFLGHYASVVLGSMCCDYCNKIWLAECHFDIVAYLLVDNFATSKVQQDCAWTHQVERSFPAQWRTGCENWIKSLTGRWGQTTCLRGMGKGKQDAGTIPKLPLSGRACPQQSLLITNASG